MELVLRMGGNERASTCSLALPHGAVGVLQVARKSGIVLQRKGNHMLAKPLFSRRGILRALAALRFCPIRHSLLLDYS